VRGGEFHCLHILVCKAARSQPGRNLAEKAYYMSPRIHPTAAMVLALGTDDARLKIQGVIGKTKATELLVE
jgi:hypothetical protein